MSEAHTESGQLDSPLAVWKLLPTTHWTDNDLAQHTAVSTNCTLYNSSCINQQSLTVLYKRHNPCCIFSPRWRGSPGMISAKFCMEVSGWLGTKWHRNNAENFNQLSKAHKCYRQRDDRRICDSIYPNVMFG